MKITAQTVEHVANLARLSLSAEEKEGMRTHLSGVLDYVDQLQELDLSAIPATAGVTGLVNVMREDVARPSLPAEEGLANAPDRTGTVFRVPRIIEE